MGLQPSLPGVLREGAAGRRLQSDPGLLYEVYLADPTGARSEGSALDVLGGHRPPHEQVGKPGDLRGTRSRVQDHGGTAHRRAGGASHRGAVSPATLGGRPALKVEYVYRVKGADVAAVAYLVPIRDRAYWVTGQASRETWTTSGRDIGAALSTMTVRLSGRA